MAWLTLLVRLIWALGIPRISRILTASNKSNLFHLSRRKSLLACNQILNWSLIFVYACFRPIKSKINLSFRRWLFGKAWLAGNGLFSFLFCNLPIYLWLFVFIWRLVCYSSENKLFLGTSAFRSWAGSNFTVVFDCVLFAAFIFFEFKQ